MTDIPDRLARRLILADRILFALYALCYLLFFQNDLEYHVHNIINDGNVPFHPVLLAVFFTCVLVSVELLLSRLNLFKNVWAVCNLIPSALLLGAATSYNEIHFVGHSLMAWIIIIAVSLLAMAFLREVSVRETKITDTPVRAVRLNLLLLLLMLLIPVCIGNTDAEYHRSISMETIENLSPDADADGFGQTDSITADKVWIEQ